MSSRKQLEELGERRATTRQAIAEIESSKRTGAPGELRALKKELRAINKRIENLLNKGKVEKNLDGPPLSKREERKLKEAMSQGHHHAAQSGPAGPARERQTQVESNQEKSRDRGFENTGQLDIRPGSEIDEIPEPTPGPSSGIRASSPPPPILDWSDSDTCEGITITIDDSPTQSEWNPELLVPMARRPSAERASKSRSISRVNSEGQMSGEKLCSSEERENEEDREIARLLDLSDIFSKKRRRGAKSPTDLELDRMERIRERTALEDFLRKEDELENMSPSEHRRRLLEMFSSTESSDLSEEENEGPKPDWDKIIKPCCVKLEKID